MKVSHAFNKLFLVTLVMIINSFIVTNQINSQRIVKVDSISGLWTKNEGPYIINHNKYITKDSKLIIEPGVEIKFTGPYAIYVEGILKASGTEKLPILFGMADSSELVIYNEKNDSNKIKKPFVNWKGIKFNTEILSYDTCILDHCVITSVNATWGESKDCYGGAISIFGERNLRIQNCLFIDNRAMIGAAIYCKGNNISIKNCFIKNNFSHSDGGALYFDGCNITLIDNIISNNYSNEFGGGIFCNESHGIFINNIVSSNTARFGGAIALRVSNPSLINNTIADNIGLNNGGGIHCDRSSPEISNSILWSNHSDQKTDQLYLYQSSSPSISSTSLQNGTSGIILAKEMPDNFVEHIEALSDEPLFDKKDAMYALSENSPCINAGTNEFLKNVIVNDITGKERIIGGYIDLGANEFNLQEKENKEKGNESIQNKNGDDCMILISPNPSKGTFKLDICKSEGFNGKVMIASLNGEVLFEKEIENTESRITSNVVLDCPHGVYILRLENSNGIVLKSDKLIIE